MLVTSLQLLDFRNYARFELETHPMLTVLCGPNAAGKTNTIEALQLLTTAASFRRPRWDELVRWGRPAGRASLRAQDGDRFLETTLDVTADGSHTFTVNGRTKRGGSDVIGRLPSVTFTPDDLDLAKGPSEKRRSAADDLGAQLSRAYASLRRDFGRALRQRNALLKDHAADSQLAVWDERLAILGGELVAHRLALLHRLMPRFTEAYAELAAGERASWEYADRCGLPQDTAGLPTSLAQEALRDELGRRRADERQRAVTLAGPHRDDVVFLVEDRPARTYASQGQQRTLALAWKLAELAVIEESKRARPLLLLDDVMSELDAARRGGLMTAVAGRTQTFVTTTNLSYFDGDTLAEATVVELRR